VHREVFEEVGLRVHNLQYFGSQSWPFPHSLMIAFTADYLDGEIRTDPTRSCRSALVRPG
jgi:NAD+ diphosphatase